MIDARKAELAKLEDEGWTQVSGLIEAFMPAHSEEPGYYPGWSVKDVVAHLGAWMAEAVDALEQIRMGTYSPDGRDTDALNQEFYDANHDLPLGVVRAECWAARTRMLQEWDALVEVTPEAEEWFAESGHKHYDEHLPRLREWAAELGAGGR